MCGRAMPFREWLFLRRGYAPEVGAALALMLIEND
jgi:hypothetical protein